MITFKLVILRFSCKFNPGLLQPGFRINNIVTSLGGNIYKSVLQLVIIPDPLLVNGRKDW